MDTLTGQEARINKAKALIKAAQFLFENGYYNDSVSRAYYAVYHITVALLVIKKNMVRDRWDHTELHKAFLDNFCKRGFLFNHEDGNTFSDLLTARVKVDYFMETFNMKLSERLLRRAEDLMGKIRRVIQDD